MTTRSLASLASVALLAVAGAVLAGCSERPQTIGQNQKKTDVAAFQGAADDPFVARGWTAGDRGSWDRQIRERNQRQNEYTRITQ